VLAMPTGSLRRTGSRPRVVHVSCASYDPFACACCSNWARRWALHARQ
jgi:hypothetical protein